MLNRKVVFVIFLTIQGVVTINNYNFSSLHILLDMI